VDLAARVVDGIARGCAAAGMALVGGETAEMPGMYRGRDYDLAGFCVGVVERDRLLDGSTAAPGDALLALASSGPHSNGYSLVRKVLEHSGARLDQRLEGGTLADLLLAPTRIYVRSMLDLLSRVPVRAIAHITGGGLPENLPRVLPAGVRAVVDQASWAWPPVFRWLQEAGGIATPEMLRTFNCGAGMVVVVPPEQVDTALDRLAEAGERAWVAGRIEAHGGDGPRVVLA
jgi:phosphoribosylformylglycinamidine cyclo-ligase